MRDSFINFITKQALEDSSVILLTADLGFGIFENYQKILPKQFLNVGIAEQNMSSIATGLALEGHKVYTYSIGNFSTLRCLEQIRNDICYHDQNVTIITMGGGFSYGQLGVTHFATEDLSIMRTLPNMSIFVPSDSWQIDSFMPELIKIKTPKYIRLDKSYAGTKRFENTNLGTPIKVFDGNDAVLFAIGGIGSSAIESAIKLRKKGISLRVIIYNFLKPLDEKEITNAIETSGIIFTLEENTVIGGFGSAIADVCLKNKLKPKIFKSFGINDNFPEYVGDQNYLRGHYKLDSDSLSNQIEQILNRR